MTFKKPCPPYCFLPAHLDIAKLPFAHIQKAKDIPEVSGIYFVLQEAGSILYIGQAKNIQKRVLTHNKKEEFKKLEAVKVAWLECDTECRVTNEKQLISYFAPILNSRGHAPHKGSIAYYAHLKHLSIQDAAKLSGITFKRLYSLDTGCRQSLSPVLSGLFLLFKISRTVGCVEWMSSKCLSVRKMPKSNVDGIPSSFSTEDRQLFHKILDQILDIYDEN